MALWGKADAANNAPKWKNVVAGANTQVRGNTAFGNTTVGAFGVVGQAVGVFGVAANEVSTFRKGSHPGWNLVRFGTGPISGATFTGGSAFANGETVTVSNGTSNAILTLTTNATSNGVSAAVTSGGAGWKANTDAVVGFNREKHLLTITVGGTPTGYSNTDLVLVGNSISNGVGTISTNATGGFAAVTVSNVGLFSNGIANAQVTFRVAQGANTAANSAGSGATFTANLVTSTGGTLTITTLAGKAGRRTQETLAFVRINTDAEDVVFPG